jgi:hypothetical protein
MRTLAIAALLCGLMIGCSSKSEEPGATAETANAAENAKATAGSEMGNGPMPAEGMPSDANVMAVQPDVTKLKAHAADHIKYPATRAEILAACAQTPEFSAGEQKWIEQNLPEGTYNSQDDVLRALKLQ